MKSASFGQKVNVYGQTVPGIVQDASNPERVAVLLLRAEAPIVFASVSELSEMAAKPANVVELPEPKKKAA